MAIKHERGKNAKNGPPGVGTGSGELYPEVQKLAPSVIVVGAIDWRFADPLADVLIGINANALSTSPIARSLISRLGADQGLAEPDLRKIFDGLAGLTRIALSVRDNRVVIMLTGVKDPAFPGLDPDWKAVPVLKNALLVGHADAVDQAVERLGIEGAPAELSRMADEWQASGELWAVGSAAFAGPQAEAAGMKQFLWIVSTRDRLSSNIAPELDGAPRVSTEAEIAASPLGKQLAALIKAARYLPVPAKATKPVIYGLDK